MPTVIRNADWVVAWDEARGSHRYLRNADVAFDTRINFIGHDAPPGETEIDGRGIMVMPV